jgi:hypothetical protein
MGIQFKQIDNLQSTFDSISGNLQAQITPVASTMTNIASGIFAFEGWKYFEGNADFSGAQGIFVDPNNIYTPNSIYAGNIKIGGTIATPRSSTAAPAGALEVTGGASFFLNDVNLLNGAGLAIEDGVISGPSGTFTQTISAPTGTFAQATSAGTGTFYQVNATIISGGGPFEAPSFTASSYVSGFSGIFQELSGATGLFDTISGVTGLFDTIGVGGPAGTISGELISGMRGSFESGNIGTGNSYFRNSGDFFTLTGNPTGFLRLHAIPDYTETGNIPSPATGTVFRSGNHLMIV